MLIIWSDLTTQEYCSVSIAMDEMEKYKRFFCICCCKPLKDKYRLTLHGRLTVVGEAFVTATQLIIAGKWSLCRTCYLTVLNVQKVTENVDARMRALQDKVSSVRAFFQVQNERVISRAHCNPLRVWWLHLQPERNPWLPLKGSVTELPQTMNTISRSSCQ